MGTICIGGGRIAAYDNWTAIEYFNQSDFYNDEQAQKGGGDIVGDEFYNQPGFFKRYDYGDDGVASADDAMAFRVRLADDTSSYMYIGFDVETDDGSGMTGPDGVIDFYIGINFGHQNSSQNQLAFYDPGTDANISPSTSSFDLYSVFRTGADADAANYANLSPVELGGNEGYTGPGATTDLNGDGTETDYFLSFQVDMLSLNTAYQGITGNVNDLTASSEMMMVVGSSTNGQNFNQDFGGVDGTLGADLPWTDPNGVGGQIYTAEGDTPVPEPSAYALIFGVFAGSLVCFRRRRS